MRSTSIAVLLAYFLFAPQHSVGQIELVSGDFTLSGSNVCDAYFPACVQTSDSQTTTLDPSISTYSESLNVPATVAAVDLLFLNSGEIEIDTDNVATSAFDFEFFTTVFGDSSTTGSLIFDVEELSSIQIIFGGTSSDFSLVSADGSSFNASGSSGLDFQQTLLDINGDSTLDFGVQSLSGSTRIDPGRYSLGFSSFSDIGAGSTFPGRLNLSLSVVPVPEPSSAGVVALLALLGLTARRK